jgi:hypothetical protein
MSLNMAMDMNGNRIDHQNSDSMPDFISTVLLTRNNLFWKQPSGWTTPPVVNRLLILYRGKTEGLSQFFLFFGAGSKKKGMVQSILDFRLRIPD